MESKGSFESGAGGDGQRGKAGGLPPGVQSGLSKSPGHSPQRRARPGADCVRGRELGERTPGARPPASTPPQRAESPPLLKPRLGGKTEWPSRRPRRITGGRPARNRCAWERAPTRVAGRGRAGPRCSEHWGARVFSDHVFLQIYAQEWDCRIIWHRRNARIPPQLEKTHVVPTSW